MADPGAKGMLSDVDQYKDTSPFEMIEQEVKKSILTVVHIRDKSVDEANRLRASKIILDRFLPEKLETSGNLTINIVRSIKGKADE